MRRRRIPRYRPIPPGLTARRVRLLRTLGMSDAFWSRVWRVSKSAVRMARIGTTWPHHEAPPDRRPRMPGRHGDHAVFLLEPVPTVNLGRLIARMKPPSLITESP